MKVKQLSAAQAAALVPDGATVIVGGSGGIGVPDEILSAVAARFTGSGAPRDLTVVHTTGVGDFDTKGLGHLAHKGLLKRTIGGNYGPQPRLMKLIVANEVEAYNLPQGVLCHLYRAIAAKQPGVVTHVGLHTYMDPRQSGGRMNAAAREDLIEQHADDADQQDCDDDIGNRKIVPFIPDEVADAGAAHQHLGRDDDQPGDPD